VKIYFAHNFSGHVDPTSLLQSSDAALRAFVKRLVQIGIEVCDPALTQIPLDQYKRRFEYCLQQIESVDAVVVDARDKLNLGVGAEMMFAWSRQIPVFCIAPKGSHYRVDAKSADEWIHPFVYGLSADVLSSFEECERALSHLAQTRDGPNV
jgi:hypothetical protein